VRLLLRLLLLLHHIGRGRNDRAKPREATRRHGLTAPINKLNKNLYIVLLLLLLLSGLYVVLDAF